MDIGERKLRAEMAIGNARLVGQRVRAEQDRIVTHLEQLLYEAKEPETINALKTLAQHILTPSKP